MHLLLHFKVPMFRSLRILSLLIIALCCPAFGADRALASPPIIDMHCHVSGLGYGDSGCFISDTLRKSCKFRFYLQAFGVSVADLKAQGDGLIVKKIVQRIKESGCVDGAVILAFDGVIKADGTLDKEKTEVYVPNDFVLKEVRKYECLYYGASINPYRPDALPLLRKAAQDGAVLLKWLPSIMHIDPADKALVPFYQELVKLNLPLLCHTGNEQSFTHARNELADPKRLALPLSLGVTVIAAHAATTGTNEGQENLDRLLEMMPRYPTLYADISSLTQINKLGYLSRILAHQEVRDRLVYGTDYPLISTPGLCHPWLHVFKIGIRQAFSLSRIKNTWERDLKLKQAYGVPAHVFERSATLLRIPSSPAHRVLHRQENNE
jgi:uncharacterized protein